MSTSKLQIYTGSQLRQRFSKYGIVENTRPSWLISTKGERLELDFYLERLGIAVEVQGGQHFKFTPVFHANEYDFKEQLRRDKDKLEVCQRAGIDLLYVCKKSDMEFVLTACYDALKPQENNSAPNWKTRQPVWIRHATELSSETKRLIGCWQKKLLRERSIEHPKQGKIEMLENLLAKALKRKY